VFYARLPKWDAEIDEEDRASLVGQLRGRAAHDRFEIVGMGAECQDVIARRRYGVLWDRCRSRGKVTAPERRHGAAFRSPQSK
jgi:hypothetical protein